MIDVEVVGIVPTQLSDSGIEKVSARRTTDVETQPGSVLVNRDREHMAVRLRDRDTGRLLDITIGTPEAMAIALGIQRQDLPRPMTHDFIGNLLQAPAPRRSAWW